MRKFGIVLVCVISLLAGAKALESAEREPVRIIFDTDLGNDVDDALALAVAHAFENRDECKILAVTLTKANPYAASMADVLDTFYGRPNIPIGMVHNGVTPEEGAYNKQVALTKTEKQQPAFPHRIGEKTPVPDAVMVLRKVLAGEKDGSVVIVQIGFSTNLARLLESGPDNISELSGLQLVEKKVRLLSIMAGTFDSKYTHVEYNIAKDLPSAKKLFADWPTEIVFNGYEIGDMIQYPSASILNDYDYVKYHPVREAYHYYCSLNRDTPAFDIMSVLYAARPDRGYFDLSENGTVVLDAEGKTTFQPNPNGKHRYMIVSAIQIARIREAFSNLASEPPKK